MRALCESLRRFGLKASLIALPLCAAGGAAPALAQSTGHDALHLQARVGNRVCFTEHEHYGEGGPFPSRRVAEGAAIRAWTIGTVDEYGRTWGRYEIAIAKKMVCSQTEGRYFCKVTARPCRLAGKR
ncbi:MAG: hypothetical protein AB7E70_13230 [Hyphomicrobiaceae bacterium]